MKRLPHSRLRADLAATRSVGTNVTNLLIATAVIVAALFIGRPVLLPIAMSLLLAFTLAPVVTLMRRYRIPHAVAVAAVVVAAVAALLALGAAVSSQIGDLASELPRYESELRDKVRDLRGVTTGNAAMERAAETLKELKSELERPTGPAAGQTSTAPPAAQPNARPLPVEVHYPEPQVLERLLPVVTTLLEPVAMLGMVIVFLFFILLQRQDLRDRFIRLAGATDFQRTTAAMNEAGSRLSRYLLSLTILNACFGIFIAAALSLIGIPAPLLWGMVAALMRFVPFIGSPLAAAFPVILAAAIDPGWTTLWMTLALFIIAELAMGQLVEPMVQGQSTGLSPIAIVAATAFWTLLWGPIGLILAVPLSVCLVVVGQHVESLGFLHIMLADEPALTPAETFFQRLLAGDANEISDQGESLARQSSIVAFYDNVAIGGLRLAQADMESESLGESHLATIDATVAAMVDNLWDLSDPAPVPRADAVGKPDDGERKGAESDADSAPTGGSAELPVLTPDELPASWRAGAVLCLPAQTPLDRAACRLLAHALVRHGIEADVVEQTHLARTDLQRLAEASGPAICICSLSDTRGDLQLRFLARRVRRYLPSTRIIAVIWGPDDEEPQPRRRAAPQQIDGVAASITDTVAAVLELIHADRVAATPEVRDKATPAGRIEVALTTAAAEPGSAPSDRADDDATNVSRLRP